MDNIELIAERIRVSFDNRTAERDRILTQTRTLIRCCSNAIRATHRDDRKLANEFLDEGRLLALSFKNVLKEYPDLYYAGYTQDALKEFAEASIVYSLLAGPVLPTPEDLGVEYATYLQGLADAVGELRRRCLDCMLRANSSEAERLLNHMDDIYAILVAMDYPDAITGGLRRLTDIARSIIERTRGDLTLSKRQEDLEHSLRLLEEQLEKHLEV